MKLRLFVLLVLLLNLACGQIDSKPITEITQEEISKVILLDVRTPQEFAQGHINGAINIDWFSDDFNAQVAEIDKDETIYVYCKKRG